MITNGTKEHPILFSGPMVRAILEGRKTQTRRVVRIPLHGEPDASWVKSIHQDGGGNWVGWSIDAPATAELTKKAYPNGEGFKCPYGRVGDRLWVRETFALLNDLRTKDPGVYALQVGGFFRAEHPTGLYNDDGSDLMWRPSIFMPRRLSRLTLEITNIRVERLQQISEADAIAEGVDLVSMKDVPRQATLSRRADYKQLWDKINAKRGYSWASNPWVWVVEFKRLGATNEMSLGIQDAERHGVVSA